MKYNNKDKRSSISVVAYKKLINENPALERTKPKKRSKRAQEIVFNTDLCNRIFSIATENTLKVDQVDAVKERKSHWQFTIPINPMGSVRQNRSDMWRKRKPVLKMITWKNEAKKYIPQDITNRPAIVRIMAYLQFPKSYTNKKKESLDTKPHRVKPDNDNIVKLVLDLIWENDSCIYDIHCKKYWDDGKGPRLEIDVWE